MLKYVYWSAIEPKAPHQHQQLFLDIFCTRPWPAFTYTGGAKVPFRRNSLRRSTQAGPSQCCEYQTALKIQDEPNHPYFCFLWQRCVSSFSVILSQDWSECFRLCEEVARKPKLFFVSTSTTTSTMQTASMSCDLTYHYHLHREEEENHLLGRNGTRRSSSAVHLQEGSGEHGGLFEIAMAS